MKKTVLVLGSICLGIIILKQSGVFEALMMFVLVGAVPGTDHSLSPLQMLGIIAAIVWLIALRITILSVLKNASTRKLVKHHLARKKNMPKRRFSEI